MTPRAITRGVTLAAAAAIAFGVTTPIVAWAQRWVGPIVTAALLYAGAAASAIALRAFGRSGGPLVRGDLGRLVAIAVVGGAVAPALLAWGLARSGATIGSLLLNLEAVFTVALARVAFREPIGGRVALAVAAMTAGGALLVLAAARGGEWSAVGAIAVAGATLGWALDNTLTRPLAERDPLAVIAGKGALGATLSLTAAAIVGEALPPIGPALAVVACGAVGYGLSLRLYLLAQRRIGAGRTGSVFALAPFVGAAVAIALGDRALDGWTLGAAALFATGVWLHATERHVHPHHHHAIDHDHVHRHDDGHHDHVHEPAVIGEHAHPHHHTEVEHAHDHAPDIHHGHAH